MNRALNSTIAPIFLILNLGAISCAFDFDRSPAAASEALSGRAVIDGQAAPHAFVSVLGTLRSVRADAEGRFSLSNLPAGDTVLRVHSDDNDDGWPERVSHRRASVQANAGVDLGDIELEGVVSARGEVTFNGEPIGGVFVQAIPTFLLEGDKVEQSAFRVTTDATGAFVFPALAGVETELVAMTERDGNALNSERIRFSPNPGDNFNADIPLELNLAPDDVEVEFVFTTPIEDGEQASITFAEPGSPLSDAPFDTPLNQNLLVSVPVGVYDLHVRTNRGRRVDQVGRVVSVSDQSIRWELALTSRPLCAGADCDDDGAIALPRPTSPGASEVLGICLEACEQSPESFCEVGEIFYDCEDDGDGQSDVSETPECTQVFAGADRDGDGICDARDLFTNCVENDPAAEACQAGTIPELSPISDSWTEPPNLSGLDVDAGGEDLLRSAGDEVVLRATVDPRATSFAWSQLSGPSVALLNANTLEPSFVVPNVSVTTAFVFELQAFTDEGLSGSDIIVIQVAVNRAPEITLTQNYSVLELGEGVITATLSDQDGIAIIEWQQLSGNFELALEDADTNTVRFTAPDIDFEETMVLQLTVTNTQGAFSRAFVQVTIQRDPNTNLPPLVDAGASQQSTTGDTITLLGVVNDLDGSIARTTWTQLEGPAVTLSAPNELLTTFEVPADITTTALLRFQLEAEDNAGATRRDNVVVFADALGFQALEVGALLDFESETNVVAEGEQWELGTPGVGPSAPYSGNNVWGTVLAGPPPRIEPLQFLYLPPLNIEGVERPVVSWRGNVELRNSSYVRLEVLHPDAGWTIVDDIEPANILAGGEITFAGTLPRALDWKLFSAILPTDAGTIVRLRFAFKASGANGSPDGAYIDDFRFDDEAIDTDGDGIIGVHAENLLGTDPFLEDSDGDGASDGVEVAEGTDPQNPAVGVGVPFFELNSTESFEQSDGGFRSNDGEWQHGAVNDGPNFAFDGAQAWGTGLTGNYGLSLASFLYFPAVDLRTSTSASLMFRAHSTMGQNDSWAIEIKNVNGIWERIEPEVGGYNINDSFGVPAWGKRVFDRNYERSILSLDDFVGRIVELRFALRTSDRLSSDGAFIDQVAIYEEDQDPDGDGILGLMNEFVLHGSDPLVADSDGDGIDDGEEVTASTDPTNPALAPGLPFFELNSTESFEQDAGGFATTDTQWQYGAVADGPGRAFDGNFAWGTGLNENYANEQDSFLYFPGIDLSAGQSASIYFRLYAEIGQNDGWSIEGKDAEGQWQTLTPIVEEYDGVDNEGLPSWDSVDDGANGYASAIVSLDGLSGRIAEVRFAFRSNDRLAGDGAFIDAVSVYEESVDADGDGILGLRNEFESVGTDPLTADTDGDGLDDGDDPEPLVP